MPAILLFDDLKKEREDTKKSLEILIKDGALPTSEIVEASTKQEALELFRTRDDIYLACLDIVAEQATDGLAIARDIQKQREIPVVLITGSYSASDFETIKYYIMQGNGRNTAVSICAKLGFAADTFEQYSAELLKAINEAESKIRKGNDTSFYDRIIEQTKDVSPVDLYHSLKVFFKQIRARIKAQLNQLSQSEFKQRALDIKWLINESNDVRALLHNMKKPASHYDIEKRINSELENRYPAIFKQAELMKAIIGYVTDRTYRYNPLITNLQQHKQKLKTRQRNPFPSIGYAKLENRINLLHNKNIPFFAVSPEEDPMVYSQLMNQVMRKTGKAIVRSMGKEDSSEYPMAGMFDSKVISSVEELQQATDDIRAMKSQKLEDFLLGRGLEKPVGTMRVLVEPYYPTKYVGSILQHNNFPNLFLIEYYERSVEKEKKVNAAFIYDTKTKGIIGENADLGVNHPKLASNLYELVLNCKEVCKTPENIAVQVEYGFDDPSFIRDFQLRYSKGIKNLGNFEFDGNLLFGSTSKQGIELIVLYPSSVEEVSLVNQRAKEDGYKLCMVIPSNLEGKAHLAAISDNLGLVITTKGLAIQTHDYFNALANADNFLALPDDKILETLGLQNAQRILYNSSGLSFVIKLYDTTKEIVRGVRQLINTSS